MELTRCNGIQHFSSFSIYWAKTNEMQKPKLYQGKINFDNSVVFAFCFSFPQKDRPLDHAKVRKCSQIYMTVISQPERLYFFTETPIHRQKLLANFCITLGQFRFNLVLIMKIRNKGNFKLTCPCSHSRFITTDPQTHI